MKNFHVQYYPSMGASPSGRAAKGVNLRLLASCDCEFDSHWGRGCLSLECCQVEVSATI
jgi:hypothetical protein